MIKYLPILILALCAQLAVAEVIQIEAEDAKVDAANVVENKDASGGKVVSFDKATKQTTVTFEFEVPADGEYQFWAIASGPSGNEDSFFYQIDKGAQETWDIKGGKKLTAQDIRRRVKSDDVKSATESCVVELTKGKHTLIISRREAGAIVDKVMIAEKSVDMKKMTEEKK